MSESNESGSTAHGLPVCDWLKEARIYNHKFEKISNAWFVERVEVIILYFSMRYADRFKVMEKFCQIYERAREVQLPSPFEVINVPMDELKEDMISSYSNQAEWFTLKYNDPLIPMLRFRYGITSVPDLLVMRTDGTIVSTHGILDVDEYGINALLAWMSTAAYRYMINNSLIVFDINNSVMNIKKPKYHRKFSVMPENIEDFQSES